jgi:hypothetical protein
VPLADFRSGELTGRKKMEGGAGETGGVFFFDLPVRRGTYVGSVCRSSGFAPLRIF